MDQQSSSWSQSGLERLHTVLRLSEGPLSGRTLSITDEAGQIREAFVVELSIELRGCRGTGPGCLMYPDAHNQHYCPHTESNDALVCNRSDASTRFVDKQEYLTWKLTK